MNAVNELCQLYAEQSKHSNYQRLSPCLEHLLGNTCTPTSPRYEEERIAFLNKYLSFAGKKVLDIGANTGFFSFEALRYNAESVDAYEGNTKHAHFLDLAGKALQLAPKQFSVYPEYFDASTHSSKQYDIILFLNVLHHMGDDYGDKTLDKQMFYDKAKEYLTSLAHKCHYLVLQIGYCWKGNRTLPLFAEGTKQNQQDFVKEASEGCWEIVACGTAKKQNGIVCYAEADAEGMLRDDSLGEFLNRPLFILRSLIAGVEHA